MNLSIDINVNIAADSALVGLLRELLGAKPTSATTTHLPRPEPADRELPPHAVAAMLSGASPDPTPIPEAIRRTNLHPVTQEALAALGDPTVTGRAVDAVARRDADHIAEGRRPAPISTITPDALAKPRTVKAAKKSGAIRAGKPLGVFTADGVRMQKIECPCGTVYDREFRAGRLPRCEACR